MIVISLGCPSGIGPEVAVRAAAKLRGVPRVLVGDRQTVDAAAELVGVDPTSISEGSDPSRGMSCWSVGPKLSARDRAPGRPTKRSGRAQLEWIRRAFELVRERPKARVLVTGPVSKAAIARSGAPGAESFLGHTEYLQALDGADHSVMCFAAPRLVTSLVTTHLPISEVSAALTPDRVRDSIVELAKLLTGLGTHRPQIAVASLNPHAGEAELLGGEEREAIVPGIRLARRKLRGRAEVLGPLGAETAYRKAYAGELSGVVAMYHDQATIPMKLIAFGEAVNVTMGLSVVRTSVDHGTGYDIAWQGRADASGMRAALQLARRLL